MKHVIIIPARDEAGFIEQTLDSLLQQSERADLVIVVDDGSTDQTPDIVSRYAERDPTVRLEFFGDAARTRNYRVVDVFNSGYRLLASQEVTYVTKLDADQILPKSYFEHLLSIMDADPSISIAGGVIDEIIGGRLTRLRMPPNHVPGSLKTLRRSVFDTMGGFTPTLGWDVIDQVKARSLGYRTLNVSELPVLHLRRHGSAGGILRGNVRMGRGAYHIGSHPLFVLARSVYRMLEPPYLLGALAFGFGYFRSMMTGEERITDTDLIRALQSEQIHRLLHFNRLPEPIRPASENVG